MTGTNIHIKNKSVRGLAWLDGSIYLVTHLSNIVLVYPDNESLEDSTDIKLNRMEAPSDMAASKLSRSIFICDQGKRCIWKIQLPDREISRRKIGGDPYNMSMSSEDVLVVNVVYKEREYLNLYRSSDVDHIESILLPTKINNVYHTVQLSSRNFVICYWLNDDPDSFLISELSVDGENFIRTFDPRSIESNQLDHWRPYHLSVDEDENIFIADFENGRIVLLNCRWSEIQILLKRDQHSIDMPVGSFYVREKQQLIVVQRNSKGTSNDVLIFNLCSQTTLTDCRTRERGLELIKSGAFDTVDMNTVRGGRLNFLNNMPGEYFKLDCISSHNYNLRAI